MQQPAADFRFDPKALRSLRRAQRSYAGIAAAALAGAAIILAPLSFGQSPSNTSPDQAAAASAAEEIGSLADLRAQAQSLIAEGKAEEALALVAAQEVARSNDPEYDYLLGTTALAAGKNTVAVNALERAVLVQPSFAGAWLDLAIAHFRLGDVDVADGVLRHIEENFDPPQPLRAEIAEIRRKTARVRLTKGWQAELGTFTGHTNNANFGLSVSSLQLNLAGTPVSLMLDPGYKPRADNFTEFRGTATGRFDYAQNAHSDIYTSLRYRAYRNESDQDQRDAIVSGTWYQPATWFNTEGAMLLAGGSARNLAYPERNVTIAQLTGGLRVPVGACQLTGRVDYEQRLFSGESAYNASIPWLGISAECAKGEYQYGGQQRLGFDSPINQRPGGDTLRAETVGFGRWHVLPNLQLGAMLFYAYARDSDTYSPLLANGDRRWVHRLGQKLDAVWVPGSNPRSPWALVIEYENIRDHSNIGLSSLKINQLQIGLVYRYF